MNKAILAYCGYLILLVGLMLRMVFIDHGLPYFYDEDEGHHFNRVTEMVKSGDYNPHYFLKPSLHFYLRMPVTALAFLWNVKEGHVRSIKEVRTRDKDGLAGYAFTASHPGIVKWNRLFSIICDLIAIWLVFKISLLLGLSGWTALFPAALVAVTPTHVSEIAKIAVDPILIPLVLASLLFGIHYLKNASQKNALFYSAVFAGLATSTKYNAGVILLVPLVLAAVPFSLQRVSVVLGIFIAAFFAATPYAIKELPLFLDHVGYEIWHYGIAGHVGHMAEPGLQQFGFYLNHLGMYDVGWIALILAAAGIALGARSHDKVLLIIAIFPVAYLGFMSTQKANFVRNMLVLAPFLALLAGYSLARLPTKARAVVSLATFAIPLFISIYRIQGELTAPPDSRDEASKIIQSFSNDGLRVAVLGKMQLRPQTLRLPGVTVLSKNDQDTEDNYIDLTKLHQEGFNKLITHLPIEKATLSTQIPGITEKQRIVKNPAIYIYDVRGQ